MPDDRLTPSPRPRPIHAAGAASSRLDLSQQDGHQEFTADTGPSVPGAQNDAGTQNGHTDISTNGSVPTPDGTQKDHPALGADTAQRFTEQPGRPPEYRADSSPRERPGMPALIATTTNQELTPNVSRDHTESSESLPPVADERGPLGPLLAVLLIGLLVGGLAGVLVGSLAAPSSSASALIQISPTPDPGLALIQPANQSPTATSELVADEFVWLSSDGFTQLVSQRTSAAAAKSLIAMRVGQSSVVSLSATASTDAAALGTVQAAVAVYTDRRQALADQQIKDSLAGVDRALADLNAAAPPGGRGGPDIPAQLGQLQSLHADLLVIAGRNASPVQVMQPATLGGGSGGSKWLLAAALGAAVGGLLAVGGFTVWRSRTSTIITASDAATIADRVLYPQIGLGRDWAVRALQVLLARDRYAARLLVTQISGRSRMDGRVIGVVAASPASGSRAVATLIAAGMAKRTPTLFVELNCGAGTHPLASPAADALPTPLSVASTSIPGLDILTLETDSSAPTSPNMGMFVAEMHSGRRCVIVDVGTSAELLRLLPPSCQNIMVFGLGVDTLPHSRALAASVRSGPHLLLGVVTKLPLREQFRARRHKDAGV